MRMKPLDYMSFKNGILQDWVREAKYDYDIEKLGMVQQVLSLIQLVYPFLILIDFPWLFWRSFCKGRHVRCCFPFFKEIFNCKNNIKG